MARKADLYIKQLNPIFSNYIKTEDPSEIIEFLIQNSNLPGRRANLELASTFVSIVKKLEKNN